jgi:hypothetical protein
LALAALALTLEWILESEQFLDSAATLPLRLRAILTTVGLASCAMVLNVPASIGPTSGALLVLGMSSEPAIDSGASPNRDAMTMPTTRELRAIITE